jgi:hypothetical protein
LERPLPIAKRDDLSVTHTTNVTQVMHHPFIEAQLVKIVDEQHGPRPKAPRISHTGEC